MNPSSRLLTTLFLVINLTLTAMGLLTIYSTTYAIASNRFLFLQAVWCILGVIAIGTLVLIPLEVLAKWSRWILLATILVLAYLAFANLLNGLTKIQMPLVTIRGGACRWLNIGSKITLQPSEFAKFGLILYLCSYYGSLTREQISHWKEGFFQPLIPAAITLAMILGGRSLSVTLLCAIITGLTMYISGVRLKCLLITVLAGILLAGTAIALTPYRRQRIKNYFHKNEKDTTVKTNNYQLDSAVCAMGSGGMTGLGLGRGRLKHKDIPEARTDFIFAVIGEEAGFAGMFLGIICYLAFGAICILIGRKAHDKTGMLICYVIGIVIPAQAFVNLSVVSGLAPTTGVTAPLVSYGGSSVLSVALCIGLVLNVCRRNSIEEQKLFQE